MRALHAALLAVAVACAGCGGSFNEAAAVGHQERAIVSANLAGVDVVQPAPPSALCVSLDSARRNWGMVAKASAVIAGSSLIASWPVDDKTSRIILLSTGTLIAVVGGVAVYASEDYGSTWAKTCSTP